MNIDKIYIISLQAGDHTEQKRLADKLESLGLRNPTGFEVVQGFNGKTDITPHGHSIYPKWNLGNATGNDWWKRDITPGEVGCAISHTIVWNKILEDGQWYAYYANRAPSKSYDGYPIYFEMGEQLYVQTLNKYNQSRIF